METYDKRKKGSVGGSGEKNLLSLSQAMALSDLLRAAAQGGLPGRK